MADSVRTTQPLAHGLDPNPNSTQPQPDYVSTPTPQSSTTTPMANDATPNNGPLPPAPGAANTPTANASADAVPPQNTSANSAVRPGGAPARVYMNEKIVPYLLEGMKGVTKEQPANPLRVLGEFLIAKSAEVEGQGQGQGSGKTPE